MALSSLIVKIGVKDEELQKALAGIGSQAKTVDEKLKALGETPVGQQAIKSLEQMQKSMKAITDSYQALADRAVNAARGIEIIGGVSKLTSDDLAAMNRTVTKGIDAFRALGQDAPANLVALAAATKGAGSEWDKFVKGFNIEQAIANPTATAKQAILAFTETLGATAIAAAAVVTAVVAAGIAIFKLATDAAEVGWNLDDMADKTGMSVPALSRLQNAAAVAGTNLGTLTDAVFKVEQRMGEGGAEWDKALAKMGLSTEALRAAGPDNLLQLLADGLGGIQDPADRAATGVALMGKGAKDVVPILADLNAAFALTNDISPWTAQQAADAEKFQMQMASLVVHVEALGTALGRDLIPYVSGFVSVAVEVGSVVARLVGQFSGITSVLKTMASAWRNAAAALEVLRGVAAKLPPVTGDAKAGVEKWQKSVSDLALKVPTLTDALRTEEFATKALNAQHAEIVKTQTAASASTKKFTEELAHSTEAAHKVEAGFFGLHTAVGVLDSREIDAMKDMVKLREEIDKIEGSAHIANFGFKGMADGLKNVGTQVDLVAPKLKTGLADSLRDIPNILIKAFEGGGGIGGALKAIAVQLGVDFGKQLNEGIKSSLAAGGSGFNAVTGKAAAATGAIAGLGAAMSGASGKAAAASAAMAGVSVAAGAIGTGAAIGGAVALGAATAGIGLAAVGAYIAIKHFLNNTEKKINPVREQFVQLHGGLAALNAEAASVGMTLTAMLNAKNAEQYNKAINDLNAAFDLQTYSTAALDEAIKKYGFSIEELGPALQRQELGKQAEGIFQDWSILNAAGINTVAIATRMADSINTYTQQAVAMGIEVPAAMKPMLQTMIDQGLLTDAAGNKITDLSESGITFAETMSEGFKKVVDAVTKLADSIAGRLGTAIASIPTTVNVDVDLNAHWNIPDMPQDNFAARGGLVTAHGIQHMARGGRILPFLSRGTDTVPAMLTPGERVLTVQETQAYDAGGTTIMQRGMSTAAMERKLDQLRLELAEQRRSLPKAIRDAVLLAG